MTTLTTTPRSTQETVVFAADRMHIRDLAELFQNVGKDSVYAVKIHEGLDRYGNLMVEFLKTNVNAKIFIDYKLHDMVDTVTERVKGLLEYTGAHILTIHASGGVPMMRAAVEASWACGAEIYAVTVLTSLSDEETRRIFRRSRMQQALVLAKMAKEAGVAGIVCSAREVGMLSLHPELQGLKFLVPGVRSVGVAANDQKNVATPAEALADGATHVVIGRQIAASKDPAKALQELREEIEGVPRSSDQAVEMLDPGAETTALLTRCNSFWKYDPERGGAHAVLTSGLCSDGFVDVAGAMTYPEVCEAAAEILVERLRRVYKGKVGWVIGSDHSAATLSMMVALLLGARHDFTEKVVSKDHDTGITEEVQVWQRQTIEPGELVLQVEEIVSTTKTLRMVRSGVQKGNKHPVAFVPYVLTLAHRSSAYEFEGSPILFGAHYDISTWNPHDCPLCQNGSERAKYKLEKHKFVCACPQV